MEHYYNALHILDELDVKAEHLGGPLQELRRIGIGCVNSLVLVLAYIVDRLAAFYASIRRRIKTACQYCLAIGDHTLKRFVSTRNKAIGALLQKYRATKELVFAYCFTVRYVVLNTAVAIKEHLAKVIPSRETFYLSPVLALFLAYLSGVQIPFLLYSPYKSGTMIASDSAISTLITLGILLMKWRDSFVSASDQILKCLGILPYFVPTCGLLYAFLCHSNYESFHLGTTFPPPDYTSFAEDMTSDLFTFTVPLWLHRSHAVVVCIFAVGLMLSLILRAVWKALIVSFAQRIAFACAPHLEPVKECLMKLWVAISGLVAQVRNAMSASLQRASPRLHQVSASVCGCVVDHSSILPPFAIFSFSIVFWASNHDFGNIISTAITRNLDYDVEFLSVAFACLEHATRACIWSAQKMIDLHETLENGSFNRTHWLWAARAEWLDGCMCTLIIAAVWYATVYMVSAFWKSKLGTMLQYAISAVETITAAVLIDMLWAPKFLYVARNETNR